MKRILATLAALALVALAGPAAAARDWSTTVTQTPAGAFVLGNPKAPVRLVEYLSLSCSHCAAFSAEGWPPLRSKYIAPGRVSIEVRHALRDGYDIAASLLARCEGPKGFFAATDFYFGRQGDWLARASQARLDTSGLTPEQSVVKFAEAAGLDVLARSRGMTPARVTACLTGAADRAKITAMAEEAWKVRQIGGTPAFLINGRPTSNVYDWATLEPQLAAALKK